MRKSFLYLATLAFIALGFVACESDSVGGIKKPLVYKNFDNQLKPYYAIQSQDNNTVIEDYVVNRGNCNAYFLMYKFDVNKTKNKEVKNELCAKHKICYEDKYRKKDDEFYYSDIQYLLDKQGNKIIISFLYGGSSAAPKEIYSSNIDFYNNLHDDFKQFYDKVEPTKLGFGESMRVKTNCSADRIMEIELTLNGGKKVTYKFDPQYGGF